MFVTKKVPVHIYASFQQEKWPGLWLYTDIKLRIKQEQNYFQAINHISKKAYKVNLYVSIRTMQCDGQRPHNLKI
jgi:hypothetical protein